TPLSDAELDRLSELLERYAVPHGGMSLEMLDGFLSALVVGPEPVPPGEYEPEVWGHGAPSLPPGDDGRDAELLLMRLAGSVARREWAWEAGRAGLEWTDGDLAELAVLAGYEIDPPEPLTWVERNAMVAEIPDMLHALHEQRLAALRPAPARAESRPGRNE